jgi:hypothetical protein
MPKVIDERKDETTNGPQGEPKLEPRHQEKSNHVTGKLMRRRPPQPEEQKEPDSHPAATTTGTGEE